MELSEIRGKIDAVDDQLLALFLERLELVEEVAAYKCAHSLPIQNKGREQAVLDRVSKRSGERAKYARRLFSAMFEIAKDLEGELMDIPGREGGAD